ncbi:MAG: Dihydroorotate dehydrogenase family protein [Candidatus Falkowbacteria bacterium GW2011_GWC2_38_22]|uniref:Dihydroorotate dehydrogenase n=1 Tax=Candidatus Falkowbacteria bacterium GW2011_GWE1_38_31 TaxID=1618638 RepID=A0A0G0K0Z4_9BACT|nr:MAG: Dihydroorotate dehydrogenase family protein [Candidatus Falkowbacteria bacterium GW2011_GWF2_38_1205]KKQ60733.1 MAG: Dihydroorotate dehydrogenase family protein [Candidatus Falkowbacteria bacterium GW2011_GWC2_38_22]KKQ62405.1 MAG: Dihydroorotate dehydrogenase family protein [Candidatus Falkowbacteria bacterium GW2011_GWF1_38_22]KKQ64460.1 MAG: Dihydroorotate dehydrogenase family protein [Candidatus Falkowbacteria bacterium GW2011_GWE2_38_254]KKQ69095.1 MAG: Dihydroorotate dehydrogenase
MEKNHRAIVKKCELERTGSDVVLLEMEIIGDQKFSAGPGQFILLEPKYDRSVMPRPFSIVEIEDNVISVLIKMVGENTRAYSELKPGDKIGFTGPLGAEIEIDYDAENIIVVGAGSGVASLVLLAKRLKDEEKHVKVILGAKNMSQISGVGFFEKYGICFSTITETEGEHKGYITDLLLEENLKYEFGSVTIVACGPRSMLKRVSEICDFSDNTCLVIFEEVMACGTGSCKGCAIFGNDGSVKHVCTDGPAFSNLWIDWDKLIPKAGNERKTIYVPALEGMKSRLKDLLLEYPTMNSSGCLGIEVLEQGLFDISKLGVLVTKGVTVLPRAGNVMPRICETPAGMINSIGLENVGLERFVDDELPRWLSLGKPVFVNISGFSIDEYITLAKAIDKTDAAGIEINISCPNLQHGGVAFGVDPNIAQAITNEVCNVTNKIVIVKLTPNVTDIVEIAKEVVKGGADAISLINTVQAMSINPFTLRSKIGAIFGGLSGPAIRPIAVRMVHQIRKARLKVPIIGMGGIEDGESAAEFFIAGANLVAVGTGGFGNHQIFSEINDKLEKIIRHHGFTSITQLVGSLETS